MHGAGAPLLHPQPALMAWLCGLLRPNTAGVSTGQVNKAPPYRAETMTASPSLHLRPGVWRRTLFDSRKRPGKKTDPATNVANMVPRRAPLGTEVQAQLYRGKDPNDPQATERPERSNCTTRHHANPVT